MSDEDRRVRPLRRLIQKVLGGPKDVEDRSIFHKLSLIPLLAWIGLGADGLSSSSYGPEEAFRTLGTHVYLSLQVKVEERWSERREGLRKVGYG